MFRTLACLAAAMTITAVVLGWLEPRPALASLDNETIVALANLMAYAPGATVEENPGIFDGFEHSLDLLKLDSEVSEAMLDEYLSLREHALGSVDSSWPI